MIINDTDLCEDTWVLNEYQQWLNKVGANLILVAAQRLVLTQCWWPLNLNPLHHSFCCVSLEQLQTLPPTRRWHAWDPPQLARSWLDFNLQFNVLEPKISFELLPEMQSVFFFQEAQNSWSGGVWVFLVWKQKTVDVDVDESVQWLFCSNTGSLSKQRRLCCRRLQRLLHVSLVTSGDLCSFLFSLVRSGDVLQFLWQSTF